MVSRLSGSNGNRFGTRDRTLDHQSGANCQDNGYCYVGDYQSAEHALARSRGGCGIVVLFKQIDSGSFTLPG